MIRLPIIYLSGTIDGLTEEDATNWRNDVKRLYPFYEYRDPARIIYEVGEKNVKKVVIRDKTDMEQSDVILVNLTQYSAGTCMEILHGFNLSKLVLVVNSTGKKRSELSAWIRYHATEIFPSRHDAMTYLAHLYADIRHDNQHYVA